MSLGLAKRFLGPFGEIIILELSTCIDMAHPQHFFNPNDISYSLWYLGGNNVDQFFVGIMVTVTEDGCANILIEFAFEDIVNYCLIDCRTSSQKFCCFW